MADFDTPSENARKFSLQHIRSRKSFDNETRRSKKIVPKPTVSPSFLKETYSNDVGQKSNYEKVGTSNVVENNKVAVETANILTGVMYFESGIDSLSEAVIESTVIAYDIMKTILVEVPNYEEELRFIASTALIFYGGSWTTLASTIAALEAFGTKQVLEDAFEVGKVFLFDDSDEAEVTPDQIKDMFRKLGLQIALLIAVLVSPSWAEICITIAFASKYTSLVPVQELLKKLMSGLDPDDSEFEDYFRIIDRSWFDLVAVILCNILSLTFFGCFPRLTTAMYMAYLGVSLFMEGLVNRPINILVVWDFEIFDETVWMKKSTQYGAWGIVAVMAVWQACSDYDGLFLFLSWSMFLYPVVKVYKLLEGSSACLDAKVE